MANKNPFLQNPFDALADEFSSSTYSPPEVDGVIPGLPASQRNAQPVQAPSALAPLFYEAAEKYGVPANVLVALAHQESSFNPDAIGPPTKWGRAKGMMQYLDSTAEAVGINPFDPAQAIDAAARQMSERLAKGDTLQEAIMAHHGGDNRDIWGPKTRAYGEQVLAKAGEINMPAPRAPRPEQAGIAPPQPTGIPSHQNDPYEQALDLELSNAKPVEGDPAAIEGPDVEEAKAPKNEGSNILTDLGNLLAIGADNAALNFREGVRQVFGDGVVEAIDKADKWMNGKESVELLEGRIEENTAELTDETQAARNKKWIVEYDEPSDDGEGEKKSYGLGPAWTDWRSYAAGLVESLPETAVVMAPSGILAKGVYSASIARGASKAVAAKRAATAATIAGGLAEGFMGGGAVARETMERINEIPNETLLQSEAIQTLMDEGMSLDEAKAAFAEDAGTKGFLIGGVATGIFGGAGDRVLAKILTEGASNRLTAAIRGAIAEGVFEEMPQEMAQTATSNYLVSEVDPSVKIADGLLNAGAGGLVLGGTMGFGLGAAAGGQRLENDPVIGTPPGQQQTNDDGTALDGTIGQGAGPLPGGPLERAVQEAMGEEAVEAAKGQRVSVETPVGEIAGVVEDYTEDGQGGFTARILGDDGMAYEFNESDGVAIRPQREGLSDDVDGGVPDVGAAGDPGVAPQPLDQQAAGTPDAADGGIGERGRAGEPLADSGTGVPAAGDAADAQPALTETAGSSLQDSPASWVIRNKETGEVVMETFDPAKVDALNTEKYEAVPALRHLQELNASVREGGDGSSVRPSLPEPDDSMVLRSNGSPFASEGNARQAMRNRRLSGYEPVEVRGGWALAPTETEERQAAQSLRPTGERDVVSTPAGRDVDVEYAVVEARDLVTSNDEAGNVNPDYPAELQPRDRSRVASQNQINEIAGRLNPRLLGRSASTTDGAPIVSESGVVESGNGRTLAIRQAYRRGNGDAYRDWLLEQGYNIGGMDQPVLVRVRRSEMTPEDLQDYTRESNQRTTLSLSATEQAMADAGKVMPIIEDYVGGDINAAGNRDFVRKFVRDVVGQSERADMVDSSGMLSQEGRRRVEAAMMAAAYGDPGIVTDIFESADTDIKAIGGALMDVAGKWAQMRQRSAEGSIADGMDLTDNLIDAVNLIRRARAEGMTLPDLINQRDAFEGDIDPATEGFLRIFYRGDNLRKARGRDKVADALNFYADQALASQPGAGLFGDTVTGSQVLEATNERQRRQEGEQPASPVRDAEDAGPTGGQRQGSRAETVREEAGQEADPAASQAEDISPILESYTEEEIRQREAEQQEAREAEAEQRRQEEQRARADEQVGDFTLTGSDRPADVAMAAGQDDMFVGGQQEVQPEAEQVPEPDANTYNGEPIVAHTTKRGRELEGVVRDIPLSEAKEIDPYAFRKDGGSFIRLERLREAEENDSASGIDEGVERDRGDAEVADSGDGEVVPAQPVGSDEGAGSAGREAGEGRESRQGDQRISDDSAASGRERGHQPLYSEDGTFAVEDSAAGDTDGSGSREPGGERDAVEQRREREVIESSPSTTAPDVVERKRLQKEADGTPTTWGDAANIEKALPLLLPEQQQDVVKAEARLFTNAGNGMMFTNGTGTGKTATGLGQAKRFMNNGQDNIIIVVPSDKIAGDWVDFAKMLNIPLKQLASTQDNGGSGPVITTYANFAQNDSLTERDWDLVITDEAHKLSSAADGRATDALRKLRALTGHHDGFYTWVTSRYSEDYSAVQEAADALNEARENGAPQAEQQRLADEFKEAESAWQEIMRAESPAWERRWMDQTGLPKTVFLSATPFPYVKNTDYAEGYLFHYRDPKDAFKPESSGYNTPSGRERFMMEHFGYRMRYNKLTAPEAEVESELLEQNFNQWLQDQGALSGRSLNVPYDYDRRFMLVDDAVGSRIDEALQWLSEAKDGKYRPVGELIRKSFDYQSRMYLLEAIKAKHVIPKIKEELKLGRKVVVFHDFKKGGGIDPFKTVYREGGKDRDLNSLIKEAFAERPDFLQMKLEGLNSPIATLQRAFPDILVFNGDVPKRERRKRANQFNDENSGRDVILVQSAAGQEGISFHDTTGNKQRALYNLGMPTRPVAATQIEGRIYRTGQASDAIFRYLTTGTAWEAAAFGSTIAERASTAENLALGTQARGLKQAFVEAYRGAESFNPSRNDGKGGKEFDRSLGINENISEFQKAKTYYYAQQKNTKRRDQREGQDYFATPEPVGLKMVQFADIRPGDKVLEPSAGHGAIARFIPDLTDVTMVEPSYELSQKAALANGKAKIINGTFEELNVVNKYDAIVMNPPYGSGGKTSTEHLAKAAKHIRDGGRIVALLPRGGMADKRLTDFLESDAAKNLHTVARVNMPAKTFERAGTSVNTQILVLERRDSEEAAQTIQARNIDLSNAEKVSELFDRIENVELPARVQSVRDQDPLRSYNPEPLSVEDLDRMLRRGTLGPVIGRLIDSGNIRLHEAPEDLFGDSAGYGTQGVTDERGNIHLFTENLEDGYVFPTLLHEAFHGGVRPLIGSQQWDKLQTRLSRLYKQYQRSGGRSRQFWEQAKERIDYAQRVGDRMSEKRIVEEFGAYAVEEYEAAPATMRKWVDDAIGAVKAWLLRKFGIQAGQVTPAQLRSLTIAALRNGDLAPSPSMDGVTFSQQPTTETAAFRRWFGDSKVVDENGQPLVVYHGTSADFSVFDESRIGSVTDDGWYGRGFYFTPHKHWTFAEDAADETGGAANVMPVYLSIQNPVYADAYAEQGSDMVRMAKERGRDGVIVRYPHDHEQAGEIAEIVVWDSAQIKSAIGNSGAFDPNDASIVRSVNENLPQAVVEEITDESEIERIRSEYGSRQGRQAPGRNLAGRPAPADWQQKTRIRASEGQPAILYRGSAQGLKPGDFSRERMGFATGHPSAQLGVYFTNSRQDAAYYGNVEDFYADVRNPYVIDGAELPGFNSAEEAAAYRADIEAMGHDGMVIDYTGIGGPQHVIPFKARQVIRPEPKVVRSVGRPSMSEQVSMLQDRLKSELGLEQLMLSYRQRSNAISVDNIVVPKGQRSAGAGSRAIEAVTDLADREGVRVVLSPDLRGNRHGTTSRARLVRFYKRFGFVENKGRNKDFSISDGMYREPKSPSIARSVRTPQTETPEFKRWFGDSKVVDESGSPKVVYHGTTVDMTDIEEFRRGDGGNFGAGIYFTADPELASFWGGDRESEGIDSEFGGIVVPAYVSIKNPADEELAGQYEADYGAEAWVELEREGYDGIIAGDEIVAFHPEQVKSATGNDGTFDPENPSIVRSVRRPPSKRPEEQFTDLTQDQKSFLGKIGPRTFPQRMGDRWRELTDNLGLRIRQAGTDRYAALLRNDRALFDEDTLEGSIASSSWALARMSEAAGGALSAMVNTGRIYLDAKEKVIDVRENTKGFADTMRQLGTPAEIDRFMGWVAANRSRRLAAEGRENLFTPEEIEAGIKLSSGKTESGQNRAPLYAKVWKEFQQYRDDVLGIAETAGIITQEQRETWAEEFYVPFYRVLDDDNVGGPRSGSGLSRQRAYQKLKGGKSNLNDLLENTLLNFHHLIQASLKNQAALQAVDNAIQLEIAQMTPESRRDKKASTFIMRDGEKEWYNISDPLTFKALSALSDAGMNNAAMRIGRAFKRFFTNMTTITAQFVAANTIRDSLSALATSPVSFNVAKNLAQGAMTYGNDFQRARMMASGGAFSFGHIYGRNPEEIKLGLTRNLREAKVLTDPKLVPKTLVGAWRGWNNVTNFAENVNRAAIWKQNQEKGKLKAAFEARDLMDFSAHGDSVLLRILIDLVPFLNARIQGLDKLYRVGVKPGFRVLTGKGSRADKLAFARFAAVVGALSAVSMALFLRNHDDEEYRKLEDWQRDTYWVVRIGDGMYFIPKPFEVGAIATMAERALEQFVDPAVGGDKFAERLGHMLTDTFAFDPIPQALKPLYELGVNEDTFTGRPIEGLGDQRLSPSLRTRPETSRFAEYLSLGMEGGFGAVSPGARDFALSPLQIDHLVRAYTGQVGSYAVGLADTMWRRAAGEEKPARHWYEYQPIRRFYKNLADEDNYTRYGTLFYDTMKRADRAYSDLMALEERGDVIRAADLEEREGLYLALRKTLNVARRDLSKINRDMRAIRQDKEMSGEAKRLELDRLRAIRNMITEDIGLMIEEEEALTR